MVREMLDALIESHGEEVVGIALNLIKNHLIDADVPLDMIKEASPELAAFMADHTNPAHASLVEAWRLTHGNRKAAYGDVEVSFARYAKIWSGLLGAKLKEDLTASDVTLMMTALKLAREMNKQQSDNVTDAHGYLILHDEIKAAS